MNQYFAALTNMRSVGVMGDERTYDYAVALRAVTTTDFMTARARKSLGSDWQDHQQDHQRGEAREPRAVRLHRKTARDD